jgi:hypothetical protein
MALWHGWRMAERLVDEPHKLKVSRMALWHGWRTAVRLVEEPHKPKVSGMMAFGDSQTAHGPKEGLHSLRELRALLFEN